MRIMNSKNIVNNVHILKYIILLVITVGNNVGMNIVPMDITPPKFPNLVWMYEQYTNIPTLFNSIALHKLKQKWFKSIYQLWIYWREKHKHLRKYIGLQSQAIYVDHFFFARKVNIFSKTVQVACK